MIAISVLTIRVRHAILQYRWWIVALAGLCALVFEVAEHQPASNGALDPNFVRETLIFAVLGPLLAGIVLTVLKHTRAEQVLTLQQLGQQRRLSQLLAGVESWDELIAFVADHPRSLVPVIGTCLLVDDPELGRFEPVAEWWDSHFPVPAGPDALQNAGTCRACALALTSPSTGLFRCHCGGPDDGTELKNRYCLPLGHNDVTIAMLYLLFPPNFAPSADQIELLNGIAPALALGVHNRLPQRSAAIRSEASQEERQRIARDLHDTLGQSLAYLQFKLDQLSGDDALWEIGTIRSELQRMRAVANEAYDQVRSTVSDLHTSPQEDLPALLRKSAGLVARRAGFQIQFTSHGQPRPLLPQVQRQVLYFCREALNNVEKHARAKQVDIRLDWTDDELQIRLADDGCGFEPNAVREAGHFGLAIMRERAEEARGQYAFASAPGSGTQVFLTLPLTASTLECEGASR